MKKPRKRRETKTRGAASEPAERAHESPLDILSEIQSGTADPRSLPEESRRLCVEHLTAEYFSATEIAKLLKCATRTVSRDRAAIRERNALAPDPAFQDLWIGGLVRHADQLIQQFGALYRDRATPPDVRRAALRDIWTVLHDTTELLQRLGRLPSAAHEVTAHVTHGVGAPPTWEAVDTEVRRTVEIVRANDMDGEAALEVLAVLHDEARRGLAAEKIEDITRRLPPEAPTPDEVTRKEGDHDDVA